MLDFRFCMQDPTDPETEYLYEAIIGEAVEATTWRGMYAFATRGGIDQLVEDPVVEGFLQRGGEIDLLVGIDAVTNRVALERLQQLEQHHRNFRPRVFWNRSPGLFHPKLSHFTYENGSEALIVGSGNLTPGGLAHNYEGYCIARTDGGESLDVSPLDDFLQRHSSNIRSIDNEALERAARNIIKPIQGLVRPKVPAPAAKKPLVIPKKHAARPFFDRFLIAQVPKAGGRWAQAHFNADVVKTFFQVLDVHRQRVFLTRLDQAGIRGEEEVRPVIYSTSNKNYKIELRGAKGLDYPAGGPPIVVFRERQIRSFDYMLLLPKEAGYASMLRLTMTLPSVGRGLPRVVTSMPIVSAAWPTCPLLLTNDEAEKDI